jgi:hypothetical protein
VGWLLLDQLHVGDQLDLVGYDHGTCLGHRVPGQAGGGAASRDLDAAMYVVEARKKEGAAS